jgi:hypothetical protein
MHALDCWRWEKRRRLESGKGHSIGYSLNERHLQDLFFTVGGKSALLHVLTSKYKLSLSFCRTNPRFPLYDSTSTYGTSWMHHPLKFLFTGQSYCELSCKVRRRMTLDGEINVHS